MMVCVGVEDGAEKNWQIGKYLGGIVMTNWFGIRKRKQKIYGFSKLINMVLVTNIENKGEFMCKWDD